MTDVSPKELARRAVEQFPDDASLEDALFLPDKIERGRADIDAGRTVVHEEVVRRFGLRPAQAFG